MKRMLPELGREKQPRVAGVRDGDAKKDGSRLKLYQATRRESRWERSGRVVVFIIIRLEQAVMEY